MSNPPPQVPAGTEGPQRTHVPAWAAWLIGPALLSAVIFGFAVLRVAPLVLFGAIALTCLGIVMLWILISSLWPARADRNCPGCKRDSLERIDPRTTLGVRCRACGFWDESLSGWFLAEEEGPLEEIILEKRRDRRRRTRGKLDSEAQAGYEGSQGNPPLVTTPSSPSTTSPSPPR